MKKLLLAAAIAAVAATISNAGPASGAARVAMTGCPAGTVVANVTLVLSGAPVAGLDGHPWATATSTKSVIVFQTGPGTYCISTRDTGSFTTLAGKSPTGLRNLADGITGSLITSSSSTVFTGIWNPKVATSGPVGTYTGSVDLVSLFVDPAPDATGLTQTAPIQTGFTWYVGQYRTAKNGCWSTRLDIPTTGDIYSPGL